MKINLENMKKLARELDNDEPIHYTDDDVMSMAYQLQYLFEAMEEMLKLHDKFTNDIVSGKFDNYET